MDQLFVGTFEHSLDGKGRLTLPAPHRRLLTEGGGGYLVRNDDGCVSVMTTARFNEEAARLNVAVAERDDRPARDRARRFGASAQDLGIDGQGRTTIPQALKDHAGIDRDVVVVGALDHVEIWEPSAYRLVDSGRS